MSVWHASLMPNIVHSDNNMHQARRLLRGVGDRRRFEHKETMRGGVTLHYRIGVSVEEEETIGVPRDIRGTPEETGRLTELAQSLDFGHPLHNRIRTASGVFIPSSMVV